LPDPAPALIIEHVKLERLALVAALLCACSGQPQAEPPMTAAAAPKPPVEPQRPKDALFRDDVVATVDAGLGRFLQRVDVEAAFDNGRFQGFRILELRPPHYWHSVDLAPGDVVTRVNGMPIERETEAYDAFQSLKRAKELRVSYLRAGRPRELVFRIIDRPSGPA